MPGDIRIFETDDWMCVFVNDELVWDGHRPHPARIIEEVAKRTGLELGCDYFPDPDQFVREMRVIKPEMERRLGLRLGAGTET